MGVPSQICSADDHYSFPWAEESLFHINGQVLWWPQIFNPPWESSVLRLRFR